MAANKKLLMLPGDGIGPEVMGEVRRIVDWMDARRHVSFDLTEVIIGGGCIDAHNTPLKDETVEAFVEMRLRPGHGHLCQCGAGAGCLTQCRRLQ